MSTRYELAIETGNQLPTGDSDAVYFYFKEDEKETMDLIMYRAIDNGYKVTIKIDEED